MRGSDSLVMRAADATRCRPAARSRSTATAFRRRSRGARRASADRDRREEIAAAAADWDSVIVATGPLTSPALAQSDRRDDWRNALAFFDAIAPIVHRDSIDMTVAWFQSRYDKGRVRRLRAPTTSTARWTARNTKPSSRRSFAGDKTQFPRVGKVDAVFRRLPADRGDGRARVETLRHGPMKPVGLTNPADPQTKALCHRPASPGQQARHAVQHGRASRPS
jgi:methylenetetrahydrofolate--tRNA-(uracil-5-)-methyltransferase